MERRTFLKLGATWTLALLGTGGSYKYFDDTEMKTPPKKPGKVIADLHCHPSKKNKLEYILEIFSNGLTGPSQWEGYDGLVKYESFENLKEFTEIDKGIFGKIEYNGKVGYVIKSQEVESQFHILALGCRENIPTYDDPRRVVDEIHRKGGIAIVNHPFVVDSGDWARYKIINENDEKYGVLKEVCLMADEIEIFNGQNIDLCPWFKSLPLFHRMNLSEANKKAQELVQEYPGKKGTASSDAHFELVQLHKVGIYLPEEKICFDSIKENIQNGNFERFIQKIQRWTWLKGMLPSILPVQL